MSEQEYGGDWAVSEWIGQQLQSTHEKPFFLACGIYRPHEPWFVPAKYFEPFPLDEIELPPGYRADDLDDIPAAGQRMAKNRYFDHIQKEGQWRQAVQSYLASIHFADAMLGRVLDALEESPHADNTIVVLWSDHGWQLGEKEHWQKYTPWRAVTRVPLMVRVPAGLCSRLPAGTTAGATCQQPVNLLSLFPTLAELCEIPAKENCDGPSLLPLLEDPNRSDWHHLSTTYLATPGAFAISGPAHRYIHYADGSEELYHIPTDPYEWQNLVEQESSAEILASFRNRSPKQFAPMVEPDVNSLTKLTWVPTERQDTPASKPDGNPFPVHFLNNSGRNLELFWISTEGIPKSYGIIENGKARKQQTRPGAVWALAVDSDSKLLGHFLIGDRTAQAIVPPLLTEHP